MDINVSNKEPSDLTRILRVWDELAYNPKGFDLRSDSTVVDIGAHIGSFNYMQQQPKKVSKYLAMNPTPRILLVSNGMCKQVAVQM